MREVCEILDCPLQTAYSRLHAARKVLTEAVEHDDRGESK
jgi:DNA-directed RNA polymerase specialized sigma24 family protein